MGSHVYEWARGRGYWCRDGRPTHLLLDGGKLCIPPEFHGAFLNAYAASLARRPDRRPCVVELRSDVFRMFVDLDTRFSSEEAAERARSTGMEALVRALTAAVESATGKAVRALVCACNVAKREAPDAWKMGFHVVWPDVLVSASTAVHLRAEFLGRLPPPASLGLRESWETIVDKAVYTSSGLRMPWSGKGPGDDRFYELAFAMGTDHSFRPALASTVSEVRDALRLLSIRTFEPPTLECAEDARESTSAKATASGKSLWEYSHVLDRLAAALPVEFVGQKFTALIAGEHCFMLRSSARYCYNVGRAHRTNNVYFMLTTRGVCQRCYCRSEKTDAKFGTCKDFSSPCWKVPDDVLRAFFPDRDQAGDTPDKADKEGMAASVVGAMPSRAGKAFLSMDRIEARSRATAKSEAIPAKRSGKKRKA